MVDSFFGAGITERDMDLLFLEEFASSNDFARIFLSKIGVNDFEIIRVEHSVHEAGEGINVREAGSETSRGESDMSVIYKTAGITCALLIEDKVNACAQPNQRARYNNRGNLYIANHQCAAFDVFMIAPAEYLGSPAAADYENTVSYEEVLNYFEAQNNSRSLFKAEMLKKAISKGHSNYIPVPSEMVMSFYDSYIDYVKKFYPSYIIVTSKGEEHGSKSSWIVYATNTKDVCIKHKTRGSIDLLLKVEKDESKRQNANQQLLPFVEKLSDYEASYIEFEKEVCIRIPVKALDRTTSVYEQMSVMEACMENIGRLYSIVGRINNNCK